MSKEFIVCYLSHENSVDFTDPLTEKEAKKLIKKEKHNWYKYYLTKIVNL